MTASPSKNLPNRSEEHTSELQSHDNLGFRLLIEKRSRGSREGGLRGLVRESGRGGCRARAPLRSRTLDASAPPPRASISRLCFSSFFFNDTETTEIYTLSLHDALPIWKSTRLTSSHTIISYAVFAGVQTCALRSEEHTSELQSHDNLVCRLLLEKKK